MPYTDPRYGLTGPSPTTRLDKLGLELQQLITSLSDVLASFDYNGADPNLVASRVAALENKSTRVLANSNGSFLTASQTINLSQAISAQPNGIILIWCYYSGGAAANSHWNHTPIHKHQLAMPGSGQVTVQLESSGTGPVRKFLYVTDTQISGHDQNAGVGGAGMVLRAIVGF